MKRIAILAGLGAATTTAALVLATPASTTRAAGTNLKPTSAAISHWKGIVLKPANLPPFWRGYLDGANLDTCKLKKSNGVTYYNCHIQNGGTVLAFVNLARLSRCRYGYVMASTTRPQRKLTRYFRFCK
jgi:hypothetical protein